MFKEELEKYVNQPVRIIDKKDDVAEGWLIKFKIEEKDIDFALLPFDYKKPRMVYRAVFIKSIINLHRGF